MEINSDEWLVNAITAPDVIRAIDEAKGQGWTLFPEKGLKANALEWRAELEKAVKKFPPEWLEKARQITETLPLIHIIDENFAYQTLKSGEILSMAQHKGQGRTADYEKSLGLADYVFLSIPTWSGAHGVWLYYPLKEVLDQENTVVTIMDQAKLVGIPFRKRVDFYQHCAFKGKDFKELLPYFLVIHFGNLEHVDDVRGEVLGGYPEWFRKSGTSYVFQPEVKVKDKLPITPNTRIHLIPGTPKSEEIELMFPNQIVEVENHNFETYIQKGQEWWGNKSNG